MTVRHAYDLYPRDDPRDGARLVRLVYEGIQGGLQSAEYKAEANWLGYGKISIRADSDVAQYIDPRGNQYVRVVQINDEIDPELIEDAPDYELERVVGGFWLESGDFEALTRDEKRLLTFEGRGTMAYLGREHLWSRAYLYADDGIVDESGVWHFYNQASIAGGDFLGAVLYRVLNEALSVTGAPTEPDDKTETAIPFIQFLSGIGVYNDSAGQAWTVPSGEFKASTGDNILTIVARLIEAGLYVEMTPDTFSIHIWEKGSASHIAYGRGSAGEGPAWEPGTIRFQKTTDGTVETSNILSEAKRGIQAYQPASAVLAGDRGVFFAAYDPSVDVPWHRYYPQDTQNLETLEFTADNQLLVRGETGDSLRLKFKTGRYDPANGIYVPFVDYIPSGTTSPLGTVAQNDTVTVHTGTGPLDYNEDTFRVAAVSIVLRPDGSEDAWIDLGASYTSLAERANQQAGIPTHSHPPNPGLCRPPAPASCALPDESMTAIATPNGDLETDSSNWSGVNRVGPGVGAQGTDYASSDTGAGSGGWLYTGWTGLTFQAGVTYVVRFWASGNGDQRATFGVFNTDDDITDAAQIRTTEDTLFIEGGGWTLNCIAWTPTEDRTGVRFSHSRGGSGTLSTDQLTLFTGGSGDCPAEVGLTCEVGTSDDAAHCDHVHAHGNLSDDGEHHHDADQIEGIESGVTDHGALTGLADDDHPQYATNAEFDDHNARHEPGGADAMAVDAAAGVGSLRTLGIGATQAAAGTHTHAESPPTAFYRPLMDGLGNVVTDGATGEAIMVYQ